jgi:hypothetical protein
MVYVPGLVRGATRAVEGIGQGEDAARQRAYALALQQLTLGSKLADVNLANTRGHFYQALLDQRNRQQGDQDALAADYAKRYPELAGQSPSVILARGKQLDREHGVGEAPPRPMSPPQQLNFQSALEKKRYQPARDAATFLNTQYRTASKGQDMDVASLALELQRRYPQLDPTRLRAIAAEVAPHKPKTGITGLLGGGVQPPEEEQTEPPDNETAEAAPSVPDTGTIHLGDLGPENIDTATLDEDIAAAVAAGTPDATILSTFASAPPVLKAAAQSALQRAKTKR